MASGQTIGGSSAFNFLNLASDPMLSASGGINISNKPDEVGIVADNPALLNEHMQKQISASFNDFIAGINAYSLTGAIYSEKLNTNFSGHIYFVDYGSLAQTDAAGNISGTFRPVDYVVQVSASKKYLQNWSYGATIKSINSVYPPYKSSAIAVDFGVLYEDSSSKIAASVVAKNMGFQIKTYAGTAEDLPFDLEIGVTKRLLHAPFGFSLTAQHVHQFNILYRDTAFNNANGLSSNSGFLARLFNHFVIATQIYIGNNLEGTIGYNQLRRSELNIGSSGNGLNGFSAGIRIKFQKLQILYAISNYQRNIAYNQFGLALWLDKGL